MYACTHAVSITLEQEHRLAMLGVRKQIHRHSFDRAKRGPMVLGMRAARGWATQHRAVGSHALRIARHVDHTLETRTPQQRLWWWMYEVYVCLHSPCQDTP